ncbi:hypothetical protein K456DRAFT_31810 [Colletotrichum gloeosporioides 23]|nr:hypothetical protein K456DRAFT_31810 [Colletotrichum gloeosporioides 23]
MSILRGMLRMQRVTKNDNQLLSKADLVQGHELDWLAVEISQRESLDEQSTSKEGHTNFTEAMPLSSWDTESATSTPQSYQNLINLRICLTSMTDRFPPHASLTRSKHSQVPWGIETSKVHEKAAELAAALQQVANIFCKGNRKRVISLYLPGSQFCRPPGITNGGSQIENGFKVNLRPQNDQYPSRWNIDRVEIEVLLHGASFLTVVYCTVR